MAGWTFGGVTRKLARMSEADRWSSVLRLDAEETRLLRQEWRGWALPGQAPPDADVDADGNWRVWLIRAGRGFGKTRAGAEWVGSVARANPQARIALVGGTLDEVRRVMIEGESGILRTARPEDECVWSRSTGELTWRTGARAFAFSAESPEALRGPQHHAAWCDELGKWAKGDATWDNLMLGLRLGDRPRAVVTTTPRPNALMRRMMRMEGFAESRGRTRDNPYLPRAYLATVEGMFGRTRFGRQELDGELVEDADGALWSRDLLERARVDAAPDLERVVVGVDPPASAAGDACGIVAVGLGRDGHAYVLEDASVAGCTPEGWALAVAACAARHRADRVVAEKNQGGDMVGSVLAAADQRLPVRLVHANRGKGARAEPIMLHYERGRVRHAGAFPALEDELCGMRLAGGYEGPGRSPDRADACVWALWALLMERPGEARVRSL